MPVTIGRFRPVSSRFPVRNANRTPLGDAVGMTSTAVRPVAPWRARLPWVMLAVTTACVVATVPLSLGHERLFDTITYTLTSLAFAITGAFVAARQPQNPIGWILCVQGLSDSVLDMWGDGMFYHGLPTSATGNWIGEWWWVLDGVAYALVFLLFPTGRLLSPRWRWVLGLLAVALIIGAPGQSLTTTNPTNRYAVDSPVVEIMWTVGVVSLVAGIAASVAALVVRFRRATGIEHLQLKQLVFAAALALPSMALAAFLYYDHVIVQILIAAAAPLPPLAAGLAILRYRLYDIDVVINRTIVYGALSAILAAVYLGSRAAAPGRPQPIHRRLRASRRRLHPRRGRHVPSSASAHPAPRRPAVLPRASTTPTRPLEQFGHHLRDQVDLADIGTDLLTVVGETVQPTHASLWLRHPRGRDDRSIVEGVASVADARRHHLVRRRDGPALPGPRADRRHHQLRPDRPRSVAAPGRSWPPASQATRSAGSSWCRASGTASSRCGGRA